MADKLSLLERLGRKRLVPVVVLEKETDAVPLAEALLMAGLDIMEVTFRTAAAEGAIKRIAARFPDMLLGAGTVLDPDQARRAARAGATFAVAPGLNPDVVAAARVAGLEMIPGVMTPSDIERALAFGCKVQKFFPAEAAGGVTMLKALEGPYTHTGLRFIPTGGIGPLNMRSYLDRASVVAIGGSWMVDKKLIAAGDWAQIGKLTQAALVAATRT
jgi:2-dehydro-3-deoxyphosphogluconate aldolase/(4S)-4-hydroxy-2-oxoglutarate aldolase